MIKRLRKRFIRITMIAVTCVMVMLALIVNTANYISVNSQLNEMLRTITDNQGRLPPMPPVGSGKPGDNMGGRFTPETPFSTRYFVLRYSDDGSLIRADLDNIAAVTEDDVQTYLDIALKHGEGYGYSKGYKYYVTDNGDGRRMAIFLDCHADVQSVMTIALLSVAAAAFCIAVVYVIVVLCSRRAIDPVVQASERQKQFITDAGHELKTPITVIATSLKVLEMETGKQKWIDKAQAQTEKLTELVNSLVTLSRMDEEDSPLKHEKFNISDAVGETAESFRDFAAEAGHGLSISVEPNIEYVGDEYAVRQLASILLDNAVKYAAEGTEIRFSLSKAHRGVTVRCSNECESLDTAELDKLFDRFYRADKSRSSGGFGIGLSIARSIAEEHKGSIKAVSPDGRTIEFIAELK